MKIFRFAFVLVLFSFAVHQAMSTARCLSIAQVQKPLISIEGYEFTRLKIRKESRNDEARTVLKVRVAASPAEVLANSTVTVSIVVASGEALLYYNPGKTSDKLLKPGDFVEVEFEIRTDNGNTYTGPVQFRLHIADVVDNETGKSISADLMLAPEEGLATVSPGQVLQIVP